MHNQPTGCSMKTYDVRFAASCLGRPCVVIINDDLSFFFTDDKNGALYYFWKM